MSAEQASEAAATVLVYSDDRTVREQIRLALGASVAADLPPVRVVECATPRAVVRAVDAGGIDTAVLDGEAVPAGGMGICRQLKDEIAFCPPVLIVVGRMDDAWLATWSRADAVVAHPVDPIRLPDAVAGLLRKRLQTPARR
jgi:DNA-binding response OmpR family regulator